MSSGAKQRVWIGQETTRNVPATAFTVAKFTDTSMDATVQKTESTAITDSRLSEGTFITGVEYAGDLNFEMHQADVIEKLLSGVAFNDWVGDVLTIGGNVRKTFTLIRGYDDISNFHQFTGCHVNTMNLTVPADGVLTIGFGLMGMDRKKLASAPVGATPASTADPMSSVTVGTILIDGASTANKACVTGINLTVDNTMQTQKCLGEGTAIGAIIETSAVISGSFTTAWATKSAEWYEAQFRNGKISLEFPFHDLDEEGNKRYEYIINVPVAEISAPLPSGAKGDILSTDFAFTSVRTPITITRVPPTKP